MKQQLVMFDLDGTLVDSVPDLACAVDSMLHDMKRHAAGEDKVRLWVGNGARMLVQRALADSKEPGLVDETLLSEALECFYAHYRSVNGMNSRLYPGVRETLSMLRKIVPHMALVTNKPEQFTLALLAQLKLPEFDLVVAGDSLSARKPDPAQLNFCLDKLACPAAQALMVGDSLSDIKAAKAAGVPMICVSYGYHQGEDLAAYQPDYMIDNFAELSRIVSLEGRKNAI